MEYQAIARKYRPKTFKEVLGQDAIVTTLTNAIKFSLLSHAYLFCGGRGTGKTTLARLFAKALNCQSPDSQANPCNHCSSCKEIHNGLSLDVIEIDGASHRGIEDIRQINEAVGYLPRFGKYKIYLIDEVHMLTKEAFNALLKTLEEPPERIKFLFATTEPHKIPATILSRCQRFNLNRISLEQIVHKLKLITSDLKVDAEESALLLIANRAEGGLRDAEVILDQVLAFDNQKLTSSTVCEVLGVFSKEVFFLLDQAGLESNISTAFEIAEQVFLKGKNVGHFIDELILHFRTHLLILIQPTYLSNSMVVEKERYFQFNSLYTKEKCLYILDLLIEAERHIKSTLYKQAALEILLIKIIRTHQRVSIGSLMSRLNELEQSIKNYSSTSKNDSVIEDPSPKFTDLPKLTKITTQAALQAQQSEEFNKKAIKKEEKKSFERKSQHDNLMRFAAVELEGNLSFS